MFTKMPNKSNFLFGLWKCNVNYYILIILTVIIKEVKLITSQLSLNVHYAN
jgi:hypothetical protein